MDTDELIAITRQKCDLEYFYDRQNHFSTNYVQAIGNISEKIIMEIYEEIYGHFEGTMGGFVTDVIKTEFN